MKNRVPKRGPILIPAVMVVPARYRRTCGRAIFAGRECSVIGITDIGYCIVQVDPTSRGGAGIHFARHEQIQILPAERTVTP